MRIGDFAVEVVPRGKGVGVRETGGGHVLARPGQVYALRLRNFGPLRCVADISIDGRPVSAGGLVLEPWSTEELERPITPDEDGCFTVVAEGDERAFGPDGGRDNPDLGLIEVRFRRELPSGPERARPLPSTILGMPDRPQPPAAPQPDRMPPGVYPIWNVASPHNDARNVPPRFSELDGLFAREAPAGTPSYSDDSVLDDVVGAAGTGLTGHSSQRFAPTQLGALESEATVIQLRLVIADADAITSREPYIESAAPARPAARP